MLAAAAGGGGVVPVEFVGARAAAHGQPNLTLSVPPGLQDGDLMVAILGFDVDAVSDSWTAGSWVTASTLTLTTSNAVRRSKVYYREVVSAASEPSSYTNYINANQQHYGTLFVVRNAAIGIHKNAWGSFIDKASTTAPSVTLDESGCLIMYGCHGYAGGLDTQVSSPVGTLGARVTDQEWCGGYYQQGQGPGATGTRPINLSRSTADGHTWMVAVAPA